MVIIFFLLILQLLALMTHALIFRQLSTLQTDLGFDPIKGCTPETLFITLMIFFTFYE